MRIRFLVAVLAFVVATVSCEEPKETAVPVDETDSANAEGPSFTFTERDPRKITIGDAEQRVFVEMTLHPDSHADTIKETTLRDPREALNLETIYVSPPYPEHLWLAVTVGARQNFSEVPVALRGRFHHAGTTVYSIAIVITEQLLGGTKTDKIDLMEFLDEVPDTLLIKPEFTIVLTQPNTDPATIDPATITEEPLRMSTALLQHPVRINFLPADAAPSTLSPAQP